MDSKAQKDYSTKERIIKAAFNLVKAKGFNEVSIKDICEECSITRGTFYYHFKQKEDVFEDIYATTHEVALHDLNKIFQLDNYVDQFFMLHSFYLQRSIEAGPEITSFVIKRYMDKAIGVTGDKFSEVYGLYVALIQKAQDSNQMMTKTSATALAEVAVHITYSLNLEWCSKKGGFDMKKEFRKIMSELFLPV